MSGGSGIIALAAPIMPAGSGTPSMINCMRTSSSRHAARGRMSGGGNLWQTVPQRCRTSASVAIRGSTCAPLAATRPLPPGGPLG